MQMSCSMAFGFHRAVFTVKTKECINSTMDVCEGFTCRKKDGLNGKNQVINVP